ncbi:MAG: MFS transporter [Prevotella sp.]|jgi:PAT family beta-lactamase induction signal transducer AmpG|nr:MFS transporter [Prevotella sp.]MCI1281097.1 MFS transporter [Prevotella sp.]
MKARTPWSWVPTLYFAEGLPYVAVTLLSIEIYMQLGLSDAEVTFYTSWFYLPWVLKPLWSPFLTLLKTKRWWVNTMQLLLGAAYAGVAFTIQSDWWLQGSICFFWIMAFSSATHDVAADDFYMLSLDQHEQSFFVGIRPAFYRLSMIFGKGVLIMLAGVLQVMFRNQITFSWGLIFYGLTGLFIAFYLYHNFILPYPKGDVGHHEKNAHEIFADFLETSKAFFQQKQIFIVLAFILLFRLPEALLTPVSQLFLQASGSKFGLALSPQEFGLVNGTVGVIGLLVGGIIGRIFVSRDGLKKWLWPMTGAITIPNIAYIYLAYVMPQSLIAINIAVFLQALGYGFGFCAYMLLPIYFSQGEHKASNYALCTGFMALSMMLPGLFAGALADAVGYRMFFIIVLICCILPFIIACFLKVDAHFGMKEAEEEE